MTTAVAWIHKLDGVNLNDAVHFVTVVPESATEFGATALLSEMQARTPIFNRQQPVAGRYTFLISNLDYLSGAQSLTNLAVLAALVAPGVHTYTRARPGEADTGQTLSVYFDAGLIVDPETGLCTAKAVAPDPTWT